MTSIAIPLAEDRKPLMLDFTNFKIVTSTNQPTTIDEPVLKLIAGDASDRKFFRLLSRDNKSAICMQFPKWEGGYGGDPISWLGMQEALAKMGLPVPKILEVDENSACIWTEDLGDVFLSSVLTEKKLDKENPHCQVAIDYYKKSLELLLKAQYSGLHIDHPGLNRFFNFEKLYFEMDFFITHFLNGLLGLDVDATQKQWVGLIDDLRLLCKKIDSYERVLCHRDYHIRNLLIKDKELYWIDFQDARMGPHTYDVVSLLRDSYTDITWPTRDYLFAYYLQELNKKRELFHLKEISYVDFHLESILMGLQRNIKALGSFAYLATKKQKNSYLQYVNNTLHILCSPQAQNHSETDLKRLLPHIFQLLENLQVGSYSKKLNRLITKRSS